MNPNRSRRPDLRRNVPAKKMTKFETVLYVISIICMITAIIDTCFWMFYPKLYTKILVLLPIAIVFFIFAVMIFKNRHDKDFKTADRAICICSFVASALLLVLSIIDILANI